MDRKTVGRQIGSSSVRVSVVVCGIALSLVLGGCAAIQRAEAQQTEDLLSAAGFRQFQTTTPDRVTALATMKPRTITTVQKGGKTYWVYPDPTNCHCLYAGTQNDYNEYKRLVLEKRIAQENLAAAEDEQDMAMDGEMWGPWW